MRLFERLESLFDEIEKNTGMSKHRVLLEAGVDPAQFRAYRRAERLLSDDMLTRLGQSEHFPVSKKRLMAWKAIDEYGAQVLSEAMRVLQEEQGAVTTF